MAKGSFISNDTRIINFRVDRKTWAKFRKMSDASGVSASHVVRAFINKEVEKHYAKPK